MLNLKKLKIVKDFKSMKPRFKWLVFSQMQDYKINFNYIEMICSDASKETLSDHKRLEDMVRATLIKEFSPSIENTKSYDLLVDTIVHKIKQKQLAKWGSSPDEIIM